MRNILNVDSIRRDHRGLIEAHRRMVAHQVERMGEYGVQWSIDHARFRHRTGAIKRGAAYRIIGARSEIRIRLLNRARHAWWLEHGTAAHIIRARRKRALSFFWLRISRKMLVAKVNHPGTKPYRFLSEARDAMGLWGKAQFERAMKQIGSAF